MRQLTFRFLVAALLLLTASRLGLSLWQWPRLQAAGSLWPVLLGGWRIDLSLLAMLSAWPLLASPWLGHRQWPSRLTAYWYRLWWVVLVLMEVATPQFIIEYDTRPNRLFVEYLTSPREVAAMLLHGYLALLVIAGMLLLAFAWLGLKLFPTRCVDRRLHWGWRVPLTAVLFVLAFLAGRGTLAHRPLNSAMVAIGNDAMVNALPLNSLYTVANAVLAMGDERSAATLYGNLPDAQMQALVRSAAGLSGAPLNPTYPSLHQQTASVQRAQPLNLVIIVEESLGAQYVRSLGGRDLTPHLDDLANQGWWLQRTYATGTRSVRGLEALSTGFLPTPAEAVLKLPRSQQGFFTLAQLLGRKGYHSRFLYGGEAHFDNMKGFFLGNGFDDVIDQPKFSTKPGFVGTWGASDEDMFNELHARLLQPHAQPMFTMAFSVSNHTPWEYPAGRITPHGAAASVENSVAYADWALGQFFERAKRAPYWRNTVFLIVADHDARVSGASLIPVQHFHIPALILGEGVQARRDDRLVSQIDLAPTLLSLIGINSVHPMLGADLTQRSPNRAIMQYGDTFGYLRGDQLLVLQAHTPARQFRYIEDTHTLTATATDPAFAKLALAHALWPSWAYLNQRYALPPTAH
ncbi:MAG: LTA synthase family protein [Xanthomonadaceae bacterium]|nr:LTA synthase family protein [Xanthomonadaceae bacterium]